MRARGSPAVEERHNVGKYALCIIINGAWIILLETKSENQMHYVYAHPMAAIQKQLLISPRVSDWVSTLRRNCITQSASEQPPGFRLVQ